MTTLTRANRFDVPLSEIATMYETKQTQPRSVSKTGKLLDAIVFINLKSRPDRIKLLQPTLDLLKPFANEIHRIEAIKHEQGGKGCAMSHIKTFEFIQKHGFVNTLVLEDDVGLDMEPEKLKSVLQQFFKEQGNTYDCVICGSHPAPKTFENNEIYRRMCGCFTEPTSSYIIHLDYIPILKYMWQYCVDGLKDTMDGENYYRYAIDQAWYRLFPIHQFYWIVGNPLRQLSNMSDITKLTHEEYPPFKLSWTRRHELGLINRDPSAVSFNVEEGVDYETMDENQIREQIRENVRKVFNERTDKLIELLQLCRDDSRTVPHLDRIHHHLYLFNSICQHF